jgi:hypothetical protein
MPRAIIDLALSAALYYDCELAASSLPLVALVGELFGGLPGGDLRHWCTPVADRKSPPPESLDLKRLGRLVERGGVAMAAAETAPDTPDAERMLVRAGTTPIAKRPERFSQTRTRYDAIAVLGAARLRLVGAQRALDAIVEFADAVGARAGTVFWAETAAYAEGLASCGGRMSLSREQVRHITDLMFCQPRWGEVIRGPAWGTFLSAAHVDRLGGVARIERDAGCTRVVGLGSGGAYLQLAPIDEPLVEDRGDDGRLATLATFLTPVMCART